MGYFWVDEEGEGMEKALGIPQFLLTEHTLSALPSTFNHHFT